MCVCMYLILSLSTSWIAHIAHMYCFSYISLCGFECPLSQSMLSVRINNHSMAFIFFFVIQIFVFIPHSSVMNYILSKVLILKGFRAHPMHLAHKLQQMSKATKERAKEIHYRARELILTHTYSIRRRI